MSCYIGATYYTQASKRCEQCDTDSRQTGWPKRVPTSWMEQRLEQLHRRGSQGLDNMSTWDMGIGSLTESTRWGSRRAGLEETGGQRCLMLMKGNMLGSWWGRFSIFQQGGVKGGQSVMEAAMKEDKIIKRNHTINIWPLTLILPVWDQGLVVPQGAKQKHWRKAWNSRFRHSSQTVI